MGVLLASGKDMFPQDNGLKKFRHLDAQMSIARKTKQAPRRTEHLL
jgi:hypothetical protein